MKQSIIFLFIAFLFSNYGLSQTSDYKSSLGYSGNNLWNPGLHFTVSKPLFKSDEDRIERFQHFVSANLTAFLDPGAYALTHVNIAYSLRRSFNNGRWISAGLSPIGVSRTFLPKTYQLNVAGEIERIFLPGHWYYSPSIGFSWGLFPASSFLKRIHVGTEIISLIPYNTYTLPLIQFKISYAIVE